MYNWYEDPGTFLEVKRIRAGKPIITTLIKSIVATILNNEDGMVEPIGNRVIDKRR